MRSASFVGLLAVSSFVGCSHRHEHHAAGWSDEERHAWNTARSFAYDGGVPRYESATGDFQRELGSFATDLPMLFVQDDHAGFLLGSPVGITASTAPGVTIKMAGFKAIPPPDGSGEPPPDPPEFAQFPASLFPAEALGIIASERPVLAMSLGTDVIQVLEYDGDLPNYDETPAKPPHYAILEPMPGVGNWAAIQFSVNHDEILADGSMHPIAPAIEAAGAARADRTVFSFLVPGDMPALETEFESVSAMGPETLGLGEGAEIHGLNMQMALYHTDLLVESQANVFTTRGLTADPWIYFTLRGGFLAAVAQSKVQVPWLQHTNSGTIYRTHWDAASKSWGTPEVYRTWKQLTGEDTPATIDGLAIDLEEATGNARILFSTDASTPTEDQIRFVSTKGDGSAGRVRRTVVQKRDSKYGSLGVMLGGRSGIGDYCLKDPGIEMQKYAKSFQPLHPDELFVARRLMPRGLFMQSHGVDATVLGAGLEVAPYAVLVPNLPGGLQPRPVQPWPSQPLPPIPGLGGLGIPAPLAFPVPKLELAVAGYRQLLKAEGDAPKPHMRTCMSWPERKALFGRAYVEWGRTDNVLDAALIDWNDAEMRSYNRSFLYMGRSLSANCPFPTNPSASGLRGIAARWRIEAGGKVYISHLSVLRY